MVADLDEVVITVMKCIHKLSTQLNKSPYGDAGSQQQVQRLKGMAMALIQFASGLRLRLGGDVYRQLSSMSEWLCDAVDGSTGSVVKRASNVECGCGW
jgi:nuclear pore complex protein Nup93